MPKRILHLIDSGGLYGAERMLLALVEEQIKQGLEPMILSAGDTGVAEKPLEAEARRLGLPITAWRMKPGFNLSATKQLVGWAEAKNYEVLHSHGYKFNVLLGSWPPRRSGLPLLITLHGYVAAPFPSWMWLYTLLDKASLFGASATVVVSQTIRRRIPPRIANGSYCIANGITETPPAIEPLNRELAHFVATHSPNFVAAGRLSPEKGFDTLINATKHCHICAPNAGVVIFGDGPERSRLESAIAASNLNNTVVLPGYAKNLAAKLPHFDVLVMPSRSEGAPILLLEARRSNTKIVATDVGDIPDLLKNYPRATVVKPNDSIELSKALLRSIHDDSDEPPSVRPGTSSSASVMASEYTALYRNICP